MKYCDILLLATSLTLLANMCDKITIFLVAWPAWQPP